MDCIIIDDDILSCRILEEFINKTAELQHIATYFSPVDAYNNIDAIKKIDIIFLDVEMPEMTGFDFLESLETMPKIVIISSRSNYAVDAFTFNVSDFLLKPISYPRFAKAINKISKSSALLQPSSIETDDSIFLKQNNTFVKVNYNEILFVEAMENYVSIRTKQGQFVIHTTMKELEKKLPNIFKRTHKSYIVNSKYIKKIDDTTVFLEIGNEIKKIPLSKGNKDNIIKKTQLL